MVMGLETMRRENAKRIKRRGVADIQTDEQQWRPLAIGEKIEKGDEFEIGRDKIVAEVAQRFQW